MTIIIITLSYFPVNLFHPREPDNKPKKKNNCCLVEYAARNRFQSDLWKKRFFPLQVTLYVCESDNDFWGPIVLLLRNRLSSRLEKKQKRPTWKDDLLCQMATILHGVQDINQLSLCALMVK